MFALCSIFTSITDVQAHVVTKSAVVQLPVFTQRRHLAYWVATIPAPNHSARIHVLPSVGVLWNQSQNFLVHQHITCVRKVAVHLGYGTYIWLSVTKLTLQCAVIWLYSVVKQWLKCNTGKVCNCLVQLTGSDPYRRSCTSLPTSCVEVLRRSERAVWRDMLRLYSTFLLQLKFTDGGKRERGEEVVQICILGFVYNRVCVQ
jgi:hypothetical protein